MIFLRSLVFNILFFLGTGLVCLVGQALRPAPRAGCGFIAEGWARGMLGLARVVLGIRLRIEGRENLPQGGFILAAKHQSAFDTMVWLQLLPSPNYVLKEELLRLPLWGGLARRAGSIAVDRAAGASALRHLVRAGRAVLNEGRAVIIFPEGTRTAPGQRIPYHPGVAALAIATGAPLVPVATDSGRLWGRRAFHKRPGVITVSILPPLPPKLARAALMQRLEAVIETETARLYAGAETE